MSSYTDAEYEEAERLLEAFRKEAAEERTKQRAMRERASSLAEAQCRERGNGHAIAQNRDNSLTGFSKACVWNPRMGL